MLEWDALTDIEKIEAKVLLEKLNTVYNNFSKGATMRRFNLERLEDETGISGTGIIVEGVRFSDGSVALRWLSNLTSWAIYRSMDEVETIHGHGGKTVVRWLDSEESSS